MAFKFKFKLPRGKFCGVYRIRNKINGHRYLGSAACIGSRWYNHQYLLIRKAKHHSVILQAAWDKYGAENFEFEVVLLLEEEDLPEVEQFMLDTLKPEYNVAKKVRAIPRHILFPEQQRLDTGERFKKMWEDPEIRLRLTASLQAHWDSEEGILAREETGKRLAAFRTPTGGTRAPEIGQKIGDALRGRKQTPERIEQMRISSTGHRHTDETKEKIRQTSTGRLHKEEAKQKISQAKMGKPRPDMCKGPVEQILPNGFIFHVWENVASAREAGYKSLPSHMGKYMNEEKELYLYMKHYWRYQNVPLDPPGNPNDDKN